MALGGYWGACPRGKYSAGAPQIEGVTGGRPRGGISPGEIPLPLAVDVQVDA